MRRPSTLDALFTTPRQGILAATLMEPERWWYLSDLARYLSVHHATLQRELARLTKAEILLTRRDGNRAYYRANTDSPIFPELRNLLTKTAGLVDALREVLRPFEKVVEIAFVYGSVARATEVSESDVDLMIVGRVSLKALVTGLREVEQRLRRPVNPSVYGKAEFAKKVASGNQFLRNVLDQEKLFVVGGQGDLERLAQGRANRGSQAGSRGSHRTAPSG
jgi:DNA-binding transcriptional ArsR family regulator